MTTTMARGVSLDALSDEDCVDYFLRRKEVRGVSVPPCTPATLDNAQRLLRNESELIGETYLLPSGFSWCANPSHDKEWQIAQHKHYWAVDLLHAWRATSSTEYLEKWIALTSSWLEEMGTGFIVQSDAQVEAKRVEHWVYAYVLLRGAPIPAALLRRFLERLANETRYIAGHLKPTRNHRTFQLYAVCLSALTFPEFDEDGELARFGVEELTRNLLTDIQPDGVQVEQSTHYHQLVLETAVSLLELARAHGIALAPELKTRVARALDFAMRVQWPDGSLPLLNDADDGCQRDLLRRGAAWFEDNELRWGASLGADGQPPARPSAAFDDAGYYVLSDGWGRDPQTYGARQHVVYDCGRLGDGSHSHYDVFNFCFYANGAPIVVDPGRYTYSAEVRDGIDWRRHFKSTAAHNTVSIDGRDQTRYLSRTKHGPDAEVRARRYRLGNRSDWVSARVISHEYAPVHERFFLYMCREYLLIIDRIDPVDKAAHDAVLRYHLSDRVCGPFSLRHDGPVAELTSPDVVLSVHGGTEPRASVESGWISTSYGTKHPAPVFTVAQHDDEPISFCSVIAPGGRDRELPSVTWTRHEDVLACDVRLGARGQLRDELLVSCTGEPASLETAGLRCRAREIAVRRDECGRIAYVAAAHAQHIEADGIPIDVDENGSAEWIRKVLS